MPENEPARRLVPQAEAGLGASPHLGAQPGGAGGTRRPRRQGVQGPVRAAPGVGDVQPVRPTARSDGSAAQGLRGRRAGVLDRDSFRRGQAAVVPGVDADAVGVGDDEADVRLALPREPFPGCLECLGQRLLPGLVDPQPGQEAKNARVAPHVLRELVVPAVGEVVEQLAVLELPLHRGAREVVHDGGELAEVAEQQELDFAVHGDAGGVVPQPRVQLCDLFRHQPVDVAVPVPDGAPRPVVGVSACMPKFCTEEWVLVMILTLYPSSRRAVTIWRAR